MGIYKTPAKRIREQGLGCMQVTKGTAQGLFGFIGMPFNGALKLI